MAEKIKWKGKSGTAYTYYIYDWPADNLAAKPGNYVFAKETKKGTFKPLYFGQTKDLSERFDDHHKKPCAKRHGVTHVHAHLNNGGKQARLDEEVDLVDNYNPPCNG